MRRRSLAADIAGVMCFKAGNLWTETLKATYLKDPPPQYARVKWPQLLAADIALFTKVAELCSNGTKPAQGDLRTQLEVHWAASTLDPDIRMLLQPLPEGLPAASSARLASSSPASAASSSALALVPPRPPPGQGDALKKLQNQLKQVTEQLAGTKRKLEAKGKGKGKTKTGPTRKERRTVGPQALQGKQLRTAGEEPLCFNFNLPHGCSNARSGQRCAKGWHLCAEPGCQACHSMQQHR